MIDKPPIRIPLASPLETRELQGDLGDFTTDSFLVNCYKETQPDGRVYTVKRPGQVTQYTYNGGAATNGQGTYFYKGCVYAIGSNTLYRLSGSGNGSANGTAWTSSTAAAWAGRSNFGTCIFNGQIIVAGGQNTGGLAYLNDVWSSPDGINWTQLVSAAPWAKRIYGQLVVLGNTLYLVGGSGVTQDFNDVWSSPDGVSWTYVATAPWVARNGHGVVTFNQGIWVMGGLNTAAGTYLNDVWFSPDGATWTQMVVAAGWPIRAFHGCIVQNGRLIVAGGFSGAGRLSDIWTSLDGIVWSFPQNLPATRSHMAVFAYNNLVWFVGGYDNAAAKTTTVWSWNVTPAAVTVVAASYGGTAIQGAGAAVIRTTTTINTFNSVTMWLLGGNDAGFLNLIFYATLNVAMASSFAIGTSGANNLQFQFETQNLGDYLIFKNTADAWILYGGIITKISAPGYPAVTVRGIVNLDDTVYVMDPNGVIYGSNISTPFIWSSFNYITADYASDAGVCLVKYGNYVVALKSSSMQFFYDAGRYPGSPLLPNINANSRIGCLTARSVVAFNNTVVWVARTDELGPYVAVLEGTTAVKISTPAVDRMLLLYQAASTDNATAARLNGHYFYYLPMSQWHLTLVYDFTEKEWHVERTGIETAYQISNYVTDGQFDLFQDPTIGKIYRISPQIFLDAGVTSTITAQGLTPLIDGGNNSRKMTAGLTVIGDRRSPNAPVFPNQLLIQWSDDDTQNYSTGATVDLTLARPRISRTGSFRRRRYKWTHTSNNPFRLEAFEQEL